MASIEVRMCDEDRKEYGGPEWVPLDLERLMDTPAQMLIRWERQTGYAIARAVDEVGYGLAPALARLVVLWLARKQQGANADAFDPDTGEPESFARLAEVKAMRIRIRDVEEPAGLEDDADPPDGSPQPTRGG